jgi:hypothetical protein
VRINALAGTRASHVSAAAHGAGIIIITTTADHPAQGDAWVVRTPARSGNVVVGAAIRQLRNGPRLAGDVLVAVQDDLSGKQRVPGHLDHDPSRGP